MKMKEIFSNPDYTRRLEPMDPLKRTWVRAHPKRCATCDDVFFAYVPIDPATDEPELREPYRIDPEPSINEHGNSEGLRETCGDPKCSEIEERHQLFRSPSFHRMAERLRPSMEPEFR